MTRCWSRFAGSRCDLDKGHEGEHRHVFPELGKANYWWRGADRVNYGYSAPIKEAATH